MRGDPLEVQAEDIAADFDPGLGGGVYRWSGGGETGPVLSYLAVEGAGDEVICTRCYWGRRLTLGPVLEAEGRRASGGGNPDRSTVIWRDGRPAASVSLNADGSLCSVEF